MNYKKIKKKLNFIENSWLNVINGLILEVKNSIMIDSPFNPTGPRASTRSKDNMSLKEAIESLLRVYKLQNKYDETYIVAHWEEIMGKPIAARTTKIFIKDKKLFLGLDSAPLKKELLMAKQKMIELLNKTAQQDIISEVVFL